MTNYETRYVTYLELLKLNGPVYQAMIFQTEVDELRADMLNTVIKRDNIYEEIADVIICAEQFSIYGTTSGVSSNGLTYDELMEYLSLDYYESLDISEAYGETLRTSNALSDKICDFVMNGKIVTIVQFKALVHCMLRTAINIINNSSVKFDKRMVLSSFNHKVERLQYRTDNNVHL